MLFIFNRVNKVGVISVCFLNSMYTTKRMSSATCKSSTVNIVEFWIPKLTQTHISHSLQLMPKMPSDKISNNLTYDGTRLVNIHLSANVVWLTEHKIDG